MSLRKYRKARQDGASCANANIETLARFDGGDGVIHLDQGETIQFLRALESVDKRAFMRRYADLKARQIIPTARDIAEWAGSYVWREYDQKGAAKVINNAADDFPMVDVTGEEFTQVIKDCGVAYGYTLKEIKASLQAGAQPIDQMRAETARTSAEQLLDSILALGLPSHKLNGILKLDASHIPAANRVGSYTLADKAAGGKTWGTLAAPNATGQEMYNDVVGMCGKIASDTNQVWSRFRVVMPIDQYNVFSVTRLNSMVTTTALEAALKSPWVESVTPWYQCKGAGASSTDRIMAFPGDEAVLAAIVPSEWTPQPPQLRNMKYVINCILSTGGVVCRFPVACRVADGS